MARKKSGRRTRTDDSDDDGASTTLSFSTTDYGEEQSDNPLEQHIDALYEKRASTREKALLALAGLMASSCCYEDCIDRVETLSSLLLTSIKRGGSSEAALGARCISLLVLVLGAGADALRIQQESIPVLRKAAGSSSAAPRSAALDALAMIAFVAVEDDAALLEVMSIHKSSFKATVGSVAASALRGWALLLSVLPSWRLTVEFVEEHMELMAQQLQADSVEVRGAAGQAIALLYHNSGMADAAQPDSDDEEYDEDGASWHGDGCSSTGSALAPGMEDIVDRMQQLATNRGDALRRNKRERQKLSGTFRRLIAQVVEGDVPVTKIKLRHGDVLLVDTLSGHVQLQAFKQHLAEGFQVHLMQNALLHEVFDFAPTMERPDRMSALEKRMYRSPASAGSKARTQTRGKARAAAAARHSDMGDCY